MVFGTPKRADGRPKALWLAGFRTGFRALAREPILGIKRLLLPVSYWRTAEFGFVLRHLFLPRGSTVLDLGSPKDLALFLARDHGFEVTSTDILDEPVEQCLRYVKALGLAGTGPGQVHCETQDGRALSYPDATFDAAYSVSVIEHIPEQGDRTAVRELCRVVKPGGYVILTVPYDLKYRETFVSRPVYERSSEDGAPIFFERHYDERSLDERVIKPSQADLIALEFWGEPSVRVERLLSRLGAARAFVSPLEAWLASRYLAPVTPEMQPMAAFLCLRRI